MNIMFQFWTDKVPVEAVIVAMILIYALLNTITVRYFGISEFYMSIFKVLLVIGLFFFTFITMVRRRTKSCGLGSGSSLASRRQGEYYGH
jgi:amino acid transporter